MKSVPQSFVLPKDNRDEALIKLAVFLRGFAVGRPVKVQITEYRKVRSNEQNNYLNGVAYKLLSDATGYERDDISEYLCGCFFGWRDVVKPGKKVVQVPIRTTTVDEEGQYAPLDKMAFAEFVGYVQRFGAKHNVIIPDPDRNFREA